MHHTSRHVTRFDHALATRATRTPEGFLRVPATIARAGVLVYRSADGTERRELVPPEELQREDSRRSLSHAVVTNDHPLERIVTADNVRRVQVGQVGELVASEGAHLNANLLVTDSATINAIESGKREISAGYTCDVEIRAGVWEGEPYDAIQRNRIYNHVAIVDRGRAGSAVSLHLDSVTANSNEMHADVAPDADMAREAMLARRAAAQANTRAQLTGLGPLRIDAAASSLDIRSACIERARIAREARTTKLYHGHRQSDPRVSSVATVDPDKPSEPDARQARRSMIARRQANKFVPAKT